MLGLLSGRAVAITCLGAFLFGRGQAGAQMHSVVKSDEIVLFFPTAANLSADGTTWQVPIHGLIFEPEENDLLRATLLRKFGDELGRFADREQQSLLNERIQLFLVDNERDKRVGVRTAGGDHTLPPSAPDGYFSGSITLAADDVAHNLDAGRLRYNALLRSGDPREFSGVAYCLPPTGVSVISDIDDTIKVSNVRNKRELVLNALAREYRAVDGMAAVYQKWADAGAAFHYVTASPWQLYRPLDEFIRSAGFPAGTFQMKRVRLKDKSIRELFADPLEYKVAAIGSIIERFPKRTFILVGDSGERDPEVFAALWRRHPERIVKVCIRDVTNESAEARRYRELFLDVPQEKWQVFRDPATLELPTETIIQ
jgi:hypothetical protein